MYQAIYKCRLCGESFNPLNIDSRIGAMAELASICNNNVKHMYLKIGHDCVDGSLAVADFQGFKKVGE